MSCPYGTMDWYCCLPKGHKGPHASPPMEDTRERLLRERAEDRAAILAAKEQWGKEWAPLWYDEWRQKHAAAIARATGQEGAR